MPVNLHVGKENPEGQFSLQDAGRYISSIFGFHFAAFYQIQPFFFQNVAGFLLIQPKPQPIFAMLKACLYIPIPKLNPDSVLVYKLQFPRTYCRDFKKPSVC